MNNKEQSLRDELVGLNEQLKDPGIFSDSKYSKIVRR